MSVISKSELKKYCNYSEDVVYHYCSIEALFNIVKSKSFWLTSLNSSNDASELKYGKQLFLKKLNEMINSEFDEDRKFAYKSIFDESINKEFLLKIDKGDFYGLSFIKEKDSLTHWNSYGKGGKGVAIGVNKWMFKYLFEDYAIMDIFSTWLHFESIIYNVKDQEEYIKWLVDDRLNMFKNSIVQNHKEESEPDMSYYRNNNNICKLLYYAGIDMISPKFKHAGFNDESEERLFIKSGEVDGLIKLIDELPLENEALKNNICGNLNQLIEALGVNKGNINFGVIGGNIRPYYSLNLSDIWSNALITEVIIGPKCYQNSKELREFFSNNGLKGCKISNSKIPVR